MEDFASCDTSAWSPTHLNCFAETPKQNHHNNAHSKELLQAKVIPDLQVVEHVKEEGSWVDGIVNVSEALAEGAYEEITEHPLRVLENAAIGLGVGLVVAGISATALAPLVLIAAVNSFGLVGYELYEHGGEWIHAAKVMASPEDYSREQHEKAEATIKGLGAGAVDLAAAAIGGLASTKVSGLIDTMLTESSETAIAAARGTSSEAGASEVALVPDTAATVSESQALSEPASIAQLEAKSWPSAIEKALKAKEPPQLELFPDTNLGSTIRDVSKPRISFKTFFPNLVIEPELLPARTGAELLNAIVRESEVLKYGSSDFYAVSNLRNEQEIAEFTRHYLVELPELAEKNIRFGILGKAYPSTEPFWLKALTEALKGGP